MKLIILDRDGVINQDSDEFIKSPDEFIPIEGSLEAIAQLNHAGYTVVVATNQSGIARGLFDIETLNRMHEKLRRLLNGFGGRIDAIFFCPHGPDDGCDCRKPLPGMLTQIAERFSTGLKDVPAVGDSLRDLQSAKQAGAIPVLVRTGKGERTIKALEKSEPEIEAIGNVAIFDDLSDFVDKFLAGREDT